METIILSSAWVITTFLLFIFIDKKNLLRAQLSFLFMQFLSWGFGALVVQDRLIEYPEGFLENTYRASFTFEFFVFPATGALFNVHFPKKRSWFVKTAYTVSFPAVITTIEVILEKYTELIHYIHWTWYYSFITITCTLLISYWYYCWFFKKISSPC